MFGFGFLNETFILQIKKRYQNTSTIVSSCRPSLFLYPLESISRRQGLLVLADEGLHVSVVIGAEVAIGMSVVRCRRLSGGLSIVAVEFAAAAAILCTTTAGANWRLFIGGLI